MPSPDPLDAWAGWTVIGLGALVGYAAWNNVDGGATGLIRDVITTGHVPSGIKRGYNQVGGKIETGPAPTDAAKNAAEFALAQRGKPYRWGATGPDSFDCSGLVVAAYRSVGIKLPRTTYGQILVGTGVAGNSAGQVGDLVFPEPSHVMIALGDGTCVEAPHTGDVVKVVDIPTHPLAIRRIVRKGK